MMQVESSNLPIEQLSTESQLDSPVVQSDLCNSSQLSHLHLPRGGNIRLTSLQKVQVNGNSNNSIRTASPISQECVESLLTCNSNNKQCIRQRQPARLLMPVKCEFNSSVTRHGSSIVSSSSSAAAAAASAVNHLQTVNQLTPPSSFWTQNRYPSASEFDTTRLNVYLNNFTKRSSFHSRNQSRIVPGRLHHRSKSVDRTFKLASSHPALYQRGQNVIFSSNNNTNSNNINNINNNNNNTTTNNNININISNTNNNNNNNINNINNNHYADHVESTTNNLNKIVSSIRAVAINAAHRALILTRSESLQSDADSGSTSGDNDNELTTNSSVKLTEPPKSALKKSPASGSPQLTSATSKNVTFSAYTTIQVVDK